MIIEKLLFAVHLGSVGSHRAGIIMAGHCLPIACSHHSHGERHANIAPDGILALWESTSDVEEFFGEEGLGFGSGIEPPYGSTEKPNGLYVLELRYPHPDDDADDDESWEHLRDAESVLRRPTTEELEPLTRGKAPWGGVVL